MALKQLFKKWSWLFGLIGFSIVVTAIFVLPQYLKPDLDAGVTFYATEGCAPFKGQCIGRKGDQTITVGLGAYSGEREHPYRLNVNAIFLNASPTGVCTPGVHVQSIS